VPVERHKKNAEAKEVMVETKPTDERKLVSTLDLTMESADDSKIEAACSAKTGINTVNIRIPSLPIRCRSLENNLLTTQNILFTMQARF